ncbi:hypothetical protein NDU88_004944 [Pleurodeles waltl]|uniref:Uncharacterized protein n=1 Tax=Pleurodeles waltl TaxID=8319 RepID=A0AAV7LMS6_PLEWA|nr:hypothetical protein NDU88_004944 [Pleurodeles waltl]
MGIPAWRGATQESLTMLLIQAVPVPTLQDFLQVITTTREALETKIDTLRADLGILKDYHRRLAGRATTRERTLIELQPDIPAVRYRLTLMAAKVRTLEL